MSEHVGNPAPAKPMAVPAHLDHRAEARFLWLPVTEVRPYDRNPRRTDNPEADRIEASIRANGMDQPLVVTQRPGDTQVMVQAGGNTRLRIVQALFAETGDARFGQVHCLLKPWTRDSDVLLAHLRENDLHGALTFIDKALSVADAKRMLEAELGEGTVSQRRLAALLKTRGYGLSHSLISQMGYAVERLLPALPQALQAGLGRPQVERLRALDTATCALWQQHGLGDQTAFGAVFKQLCRRYDGPDWDIAPLRAALENELAEHAGASLHTARAQLAARLSGHKTERSLFEQAPDDAPRFDEPSIEVDSASTPRDKAHPATSGPASISRHAQGADHAVADASGDVDGLDDRDDPRDAAAQDREAMANDTADSAGSSPRPPTLAQDDTGVPAAPSPRERPLPTDLKSLRARAWTLAARLAQRHGIGELVVPLPSLGLGFVLRDVPDPALAEQLDEDTLSRLSLLWWHLAACAEMTVAPVEVVLPTLANGSVLRRALETEDAGLLFASVWTLDPGQAGFRLWRLLDARDWQDLLDILATYRALYRVAESSHTDLWR